MTFGLGIGQNTGLKANSSEFIRHSSEQEAHAERASAAFCPSNLPVATSTTDEASKALATPVRPARDVVEMTLAAALLHAVTTGDFETASRVKDKLDAWRAGQLRTAPANQPGKLNHNEQATKTGTSEPTQAG